MEAFSKETNVTIAGTFVKTGEDGKVYLKVMKWNADMIINELQK